MTSEKQPVPMNVTYFREYGLHPVTQQAGTDYIASFPNWDETIHALKTQFPDSGNVITPEYATVSDDMSKLDQLTEDRINGRIRTAMDITKESGAMLHLGTPTITYDQFGRPKWLNSVLSIRNGKVESATHKTTLLPAEEMIGISEPTADLRRIKDGKAVLICAELYGMFISNSKIKDYLRTNNVQQILAPTVWATPFAENSSSQKVLEEAGGEDNYYRQQLEMVIGSYVLRNLPTTQQVIVSDRGRHDLAPYNAVFRRTSS